MLLFCPLGHLIRSLQRPGPGARSLRVVGSTLRHKTPPALYWGQNGSTRPPEKPVTCRKGGGPIASALQMLRADGVINAGELSERCGITEVDIRGYLAHAQRNGIIPFKAEIV